MSSFISKIIDFITELIQSLQGGYLFFGSGWDLVKYGVDIILVTVMFYYILLFIRRTRAWQLIKGIILILAFVIVCNIIGLEMVGFIFNKLLYVFAFLFIVIFQPELRRALETVGLKSFGSIKGILGTGQTDDKTALSSFINEICLACKEMSRSYTGALILIERNTRLDELLTQENVVKFDSQVSNSVLQSIFYKGSPMHDGGLLIRNGRIIAARCHVPLSVTMHSLERAGTRHRAAVGASEMGDTVVVVVSEERGKTSIAVNGRLYEMKNARELEANLSYLLGLTGELNSPKGIGKVINRIRNRRKVGDAVAAYNSAEEETAAVNAPEAAANISAEEGSGTAVPSAVTASAAVKSGNVPVTESSGEESYTYKVMESENERNLRSNKAKPFERVVLVIASLLISIGLWMYIQITNNPVITRSYTVPISYSQTETPENMEVSYPIDSVEVTLVGRKETIDRLTQSDIVATIDYSVLNGRSGVVELPVAISSAERSVYFRVEQQVPETVSVTVYSQTEDTQAAS